MEMILDHDPTFYPTSDGRPMAETDVHRKQILDLIYALEMFYRDDPEVYVSGDLLMCYQKGDGRKHVAPDVLVTLGIPKCPRDNYLVWREGKAPDFIIEVTSESTRPEDLGVKKGLYALLGVREYYIFDPLREYLVPRLRAYRLEGEDYLRVVGDPVASRVLPINLAVIDNQLRLIERATGRVLPTPEEDGLARQAAERDRDLLQRERDEMQRERDQALRELERLRDQLTDS